MTQTVEDLRAAITRSKSGRQRWTCPPELKQDILRFIEQSRSQGTSLKQIAEDLGLSPSGMSRWLNPKSCSLKPVRIVEDPASSSRLVLQTPGGYRIEGLDPRTAAELLRHLGC